MIPERLQAHLVYLHNREAPYPLAESQGNLAALNLRTRGLTYGSIAIVMRAYHGLDHTENCWRYRLREMGAEPRHHACGTVRVPPQMRDRA